ncbi:unnamed protein product [Kuraishia capsulata CBS 1993]|uniref:Putative transcription factor kapC n=1 Tax=Kuraishia capsulata CBS 1993 TaxID=1382522 RepID=W6MUM9_9ASCO|nr:uncharacterized protein KUCA_T00001740001 [Kuraishia capsulata CBS 1993]CDK25770.1 unnamed protein product [Kuraishia capsulata CBS 1993]
MARIAHLHQLRVQSTIVPVFTNLFTAMDSHIDPTFGTDPVKPNQPSVDEVAAAAVAQSVAHSIHPTGPSPKRPTSRPLTQTKRALQNRVAQRKFREKKDKTIKELIDKAARLDELEEYVKELKRENYEFRDYILRLQDKLIQKVESENKNGSGGAGNGNVSPTGQGFPASLLKPAGAESATSSLLNSVLSAENPLNRPEYLYKDDKQ